MYLVSKKASEKQDDDISVNKNILPYNPQFKTIMVVDDNSVNRRILIKILGQEYNIIEASNGRDALSLLKENAQRISLILLDIVMPIMDGYDFIVEAKADSGIADIPIVVMTASNDMRDEIRCLELGASDYITKPINPEVVKHRILGIIRLRESSIMINYIKFDALTGALAKEYFCKSVEDKLLNNQQNSFDILCFNIDNIKLINEKYGVEKSNELLRHIFKAENKVFGSDALCGRIEADTFAVLTERQNDYSQEKFEKLAEEFYEGAPVSYTIKFGIYKVSDRNMPVLSMCDRAVLAINTIKHKYGVYFAEYDDELRLNMIKKHQIIDGMETALKEKQFKVYLQSKHDAASGKIAGAEVFVRWEHPQLGFLPPDEFIPIFEKNGFIIKIDEYMVESVCEILEDWQKSGIKLFPISVNLSKVDFDNDNLSEKLIEIVDKHNIEHKYVCFEINESAYNFDSKKVIEVVNKLSKNNFIIEMDDFGSGNSSLNMLNELTIDVLKIDMEFLGNNKKNKNKRKSILEFIINLARWMNVPSLAEGVETKTEADELKSLGCDYIQGRYYSEPMPREEFKKFILSL